VFPDEAPSRFSAALRSGSSRSLARRVDGSGGAGTPEQAAAERLIELLSDFGRHDRLTRGHSERVRAYSVMLGEQINLSRDELDKLNWAALAHDLGKLDVPEAILNKAARPTEEEWKVLRGHPGAGAAYIDPLRDWLGDWIDAVTQHHERFDGTGYPNGFAGTEISLAGRIVSIADAFDVMSATRSYKKPLPPEQARAELLRNAGTQFDPRLVRSFLEISLGKMRWIIGPMGSLAQLPGLVRTPLTVIGSSATSVVTASAVTLAAIAGAIAPEEAPPPNIAEALAFEQPATATATAPSSNTSPSLPQAAGPGSDSTSTSTAPQPGDASTTTSEPEPDPEGPTSSPAAPTAPTSPTTTSPGATSITTLPDTTM